MKLLKVFLKFNLDLFRFGKQIIQEEQISFNSEMDYYKFYASFLCKITQSKITKDEKQMAAAFETKNIHVEIRKLTGESNVIDFFKNQAKELEKE